MSSSPSQQSSLMNSSSPINSNSSNTTNTSTSVITSHNDGDHDVNTASATTEASGAAQHTATDAPTGEISNNEQEAPFLSTTQQTPPDEGSTATREAQEQRDESHANEVMVEEEGANHVEDNDDESSSSSSRETSDSERSSRIEAEGQFILPFASLPPPSSAEGEMSSSAEEDKNAPKKQVLVCDLCRLPICCIEDVLPGQAPVWSKTVYTYELDVFDRAIACYSATNTHDYRFDLARVSASVDGQGAVCQGRFTDEHSWFPGFSWAMCYCQSCGKHLGWGFAPDDEVKAYHAYLTETKKKRTVKEGEKEVKRESGKNDEPGDEEFNNGSTASSGDTLEENDTVKNGENLERRETIEKEEQEEQDPKKEEKVLEKPKTEEGEEATATTTTTKNNLEEMEQEKGIPPRPKLSFIGLVLTKTAQREMSAQQFQHCRQKATDREEANSRYETQKRQLLKILQRFPNQFLANQLGMVLLEMENRPELRGALMPRLVEQAKMLLLQLEVEAVEREMREETEELNERLNPVEGEEVVAVQEEASDQHPQGGIVSSVSSEREEMQSSSEIQLQGQRGDTSPPAPTTVAAPSNPDDSSTLEEDVEEALPQFFS